MDPIDSPQVLACQDQLGPVLPSLGVALICGGAAEGEAKTDDETKDGEEDTADADCLKLLVSLPFPANAPCAVSGWYGLRHSRYLTFSLMAVISEAQAATASRGKIILGKMLPCIWRKMGHFECFWISRGPVCGSS